MEKILIISENRSDNLGDIAINLAIKKILTKSFILESCHFSSFLKKHKKKINPKVIPIAKKIILEFLKAFNLIKFFARIRWHIFGEKKKYLSFYRKKINASDLVLLGGGQLIRNNQGLFCEKLSMISKISDSKPLFLVGIGVDNKMNFINWQIVKNTILKSKYIIFRDKLSSQKVLSKFPVATKSSILPDFAFYLSNPYLNNYTYKRKYHLGINVMNFFSMLNENKVKFKYFKKKQIYNLLIYLVSDYFNKGKSVILFTTGAVQDLNMLKEFRKEYFLKTNIKIPYCHPYDLDELFQLLSKVRNVFAMRMHAGILSYISKCNPVCLNWDNKVMGVWSLIDEKNRVIEFNDIFIESNFAKIEKSFTENKSPTNLKLKKISKIIKYNLLNSVNDFI